jgi:hypothetical protein
VPEGETVKGRDSEVAGGIQFERRHNAHLHVVRGLLGEGQRQNALVIDTGLHEVDKATGQRGGLAGPGTCQD